MAAPAIGVYVVSEGSGSIVADLIFVHGLQGHPVDTWSTDNPKLPGRSLLRYVVRPLASGPRSGAASTASDTATENEVAPKVFWPQEYLASDIPNIRILSYGYDSVVLRTFTAVDQNSVFQHGRNMLHDLQRERSAVSGRPVIFVCHSLGGIVAKEALRQSRGALFQPHLQSLYSSTYGVIFLGTPHRGSNSASWATLAGNIAKLALQSPNSSLLRSLHVDSETLQIIAEEFSTMIRGDVKVHSFYEEMGMAGLYGLHGKIVEDFSSIIGDAAEGKEGINGNHRTMVKFSSMTDNGYRKVAAVIRRWIEAISSVEPTQPSSIRIDQLPIAVRQKLQQDSPLNQLTHSPNTGSITVHLPYFGRNISDARTGHSVSMATIPGNSGFELAGVLGMLPGGEDFNLLEVKEISLSELVYDNNFYYTRSSSEGILHLICDHFSSIRGDEVAQIARTSIGTFTFSSVEFGRTVRFNGRERYPQTFARPPQDFHAIRNYARGLFQRRVGANLRYVEGSESELPPIWERLRIGQAIMHTDLVHTESLRFMTAEDIRELKFLHELSSRILEGVLSLMDSRSGDYESIKDDFEIVRILRSKPLSSPSDLPVVVGAAKYALDGALSNAYPNNAGNENREEQVAELIVQSDDLYNQLESELRAPENSVGFAHRFTVAADRNPNLIALLAAPAIIRKCNTGIILRYVVEAPENWIHLLAMESFDILLS